MTNDLNLAFNEDFKRRNVVFLSYNAIRFVMHSNTRTWFFLGFEYLVFEFKYEYS